jgi:hypothetical protein
VNVFDFCESSTLQKQPDIGAEVVLFTGKPKKVEKPLIDANNRSDVAILAITQTYWLK